MWNLVLVLLKQSIIYTVYLFKYQMKKNILYKIIIYLYPIYIVCVCVCGDVHIYIVYIGVQTLAYYGPKILMTYCPIGWPLA